MKIAYFSPFSPMKSGISDFSEELVMKLKEHHDLVLFADQGIVENEIIKDNFKIMNIRDYEKETVRSQYDTAVFHMGNNYSFHKDIAEIFLKYGGILELHDIALHHFLAEATLSQGEKYDYIRAMKYCHGDAGEMRAKAFLNRKGKAPWIEESMKYMVNKYFIDRAQAVIVHSDFAYEIVKGIRSEIPVVKIELHTPEICRYNQEQKYEIRKQLGIEKDKLILGAFGYASAEKRILQILKALALYKKKNKNFHFYIVGKVARINIEKEIKKLKLQNNVTSTGFVDLDKLKLYMAACDIAFNLRYPTQGESSASLARLLGMGKVVFVTDIGSFKEYSDDIVVKIEYGNKEVGQIYEKLLMAVERLEKYGENAYQYALNYNSVDINAKKYADFFEKTANHMKVECEYEDGLLDKVFQLRLNDDQYVRHLCDRMEY